MDKIGFKENIKIEFKSDKSKLSDSEIIEVVVAFANTNGGKLYLGVEDNGDITGLHPEHRNITALNAYIANKTVPPVSVRSEILDYAVPILKITVPKCRSIVATSSGKIIRRRIKADETPENIPMYPYEISSRLSSLSLLDYSAQPVPDSDYSDLDATERERLKNIIRSYHGELSLLELSDDELDKSLQLVTTVGEKLVPTYTGLLLIGKKDRLKALMPTAESAIQVLRGTDVKVNESFTLPLLAAFEKINEYMNAWNQEQEMEVGLFRISIPDIDKRAFRESLVNAYAHRDYSMLGRVRVLIDDEGLTISNPGGFIEGVTIQNLLSAEPHGRNPVLADALKRLGLAERTGRGIDRIYEGSLLYGRLLPDYSSSTETRVNLFIPKSLPDKAFVKMISEEQNRIGRSLPIYSLMILNILKGTRRASINDISEQLHAESSKIKITVEQLAESGLIEAVGSGKGRCYILSSKVYKYNDNSVGYVRQTDIDDFRYEELVMKLAKKQGFVTRSNVAQLFHLSPAQAYRVLQKLSSSGKLTLINKGKFSKYIIK